MIKIKDLNKKQKIIIIIFAIIAIIGFYIYQITRQNDFELTQTSLNEALEENNKDNEKEVEESKETIKVHITGAVLNEGVVELDIDSRISDAIEKAGGLREDAYLEPINLAYILEDGMKIYIPNQSEKDKYKQEEQVEVSTETINQTSTQIKKQGKVNINTATQTELETLPGIGPSTAQKIISYRNDNGKFKSIEDIKNVSGIGESKYNRIKDYIMIK